MRQHILETVNAIVQKRRLKGDPYLWEMAAWIDLLRKGKDASDLVAVSFVDYIKNLYLRMLF